MLRSTLSRSTTTLSPGDSWFSGEQIAPRKPVVTVTTRVVRLKGAHPAASPGASTASSSLSPPSVKVSPSSSKRKQSAVAEDWHASIHSKKQRVGAVASSSKTTATRPKARAERSAVKLSTPPIESVFRTSRSRSISAFADAPVSRKVWTDEDGATDETRITSEAVVQKLMGSYQGFFRNYDDPEDNSWEAHETGYPFVDLEYPNNNSCERFVLLQPKDKDHYNPIFCLQDSLHIIVKYYLTEEQRLLFGTLPDELLSSPPRSPNLSSSASSELTSPPSSLQSPNPSFSAPPSLTSPPSSPLTPPPRTSSSPPISGRSTPSADLLRSLSRAIHLKDGPLFISTMSRINALLRTIKQQQGLNTGRPNPLRERPRIWAETGIPKKVLRRIIEETYQRSVGPNIESLRRYTAFSSQVYGELTPDFVSDIIEATGLRSNSLFLDLGSGVGNVALQASLESGCSSFGVELMRAPAALAAEQLQQLKIRCRMWAVNLGAIELEEGDMRMNTRLDELISKADVLLVNNYAFAQDLNESLNTKFLDLKEGAIVVSLKPFAPLANQRMTERNIDGISAIFHVTARPYHTGFVSWSSGRGQYYLHRVDREGYNDCKERLERSLMEVRASRRVRR